MAVRTCVCFQVGEIAPPAPPVTTVTFSLAGKFRSQLRNHFLSEACSDGFPVPTQGLGHPISK